MEKAVGVGELPLFTFILNVMPVKIFQLGIDNFELGDTFSSVRPFSSTIYRYLLFCHIFYALLTFSFHKLKNSID